LENIYVVFFIECKKIPLHHNSGCAYFLTEFGTKSKRPLLIRLFPGCLITLLHHCAEQPTRFNKIQLKRNGNCLSCIFYRVQKNSFVFQFALCSLPDWVCNKIKTTRLLNTLFPCCLITILHQLAKQPSRFAKRQLKRIGKYLCSFFYWVQKNSIGSQFGLCLLFDWVLEQNQNDHF